MPRNYGWAVPDLPDRWFGQTEAAQSDGACEQYPGAGRVNINSAALRSFGS
jgi:hypothetical protein